MWTYRLPATAGEWVRVAKKRSEAPSASFQDLLQGGLCLGWSESQRVLVAPGVDGDPDVVGPVPLSFELGYQPAPLPPPAQRVSRNDVTMCPAWLAMGEGCPCRGS